MPKRPAPPGSDQRWKTFGHAFKWQNFLTVSGDADVWADQPDLRLQSQLSLAF